MRVLTIAIVGLVASGCATQSRAAPKPSPLLDQTAARVTYYAPKTKLTVKGDFVLVECGETAGRILVAPSLSIVQTGVADTSVAFGLEGKALKSAFQKRSVSLELTEDGALSAINASGSDRSGAVFTNVLKIFGTLINPFSKASPAGDGKSTACNPETDRALHQARQIGETLTALRQQLISAAPADAEKIAKKIDALSGQLGALVTNQLTISVAKPLTVGATGGNVPVKFDFDDFAKWFAKDFAKDPCTAVLPDITSSGCGKATDLFAMTATIAGESATTPIGASPCRLGAENRPAECDKTLVIVEPRSATVTVKPATANFVGTPLTAKVSEAKVWLPQWGAATYLRLDVRFAEAREIGMTFDQFGRKKTFKWSSEAAAENATSALASMAEGGVGVAKAARGQEELEAIEAESALLDARLKLNKLKACEAVIMAGGVTCPAAE